METITIKVKDSKVLKLIHDLEALNLIQVLITLPEKKVATKLSDILSGSISSEQADKLQTELKQMRNEWQRDTY
jgi:hypothetical protein